MPEVVQLVDNHSPDRRSLSNAKHIYALSMWIGREAPDRLVLLQVRLPRRQARLARPYSSEMSVTLMIARELLREIKKRHAPPSME